MEILSDAIVLRAKDVEKVKRSITIDSKELRHDCLIRKIIS